MAGFEASYTPAPRAQRVDHVFNVTEYMDTTTKMINDISGHSKPHVFRLKLRSNGEVDLTTKDWADSKVKQLVWQRIPHT